MVINGKNEGGWGRGKRRGLYRIGRCPRLETCKGIGDSIHCKQSKTGARKGLGTTWERD